MRAGLYVGLPGPQQIADGEQEQHEQHGAEHVFDDRNRGDPERHIDRRAACGGNDNPSALTELTTESLRMSFLSNSSSTSISSVGQALETMARKG